VTAVARRRPRRGVGARSGPLCLTGALMLGLGPHGNALAQAWQWQAGAQAQAETLRNPALAPGQDDSGSTGSVSARANATRSTESTQTRAEGELILSPRDTPGDSSTGALGRLSLQQRVNAPRDTWVGNLALRRDRTLGQQASASELDSGRTEREVTDADLSWSHALSERLSADLQGSGSRTRLAAPGAGSDYALRTTGGGLQWAWHEAGSVQATVSRTQQRLLDSGSRTRIDSLRLSVSEAWSETLSLSLSLARSDTTRWLGVSRAFCPLPVSFCQGGLVPFQFEQSTLRLRSADTQYTLSATWRWDERTTLAARGARALTPNASGVSREDSLSVSANHTLSDRSRVGLALDASRARPAVGDSAAAGASGVSSASATLATLTLNGSHQFSEHWSLSTQLQQREARREIRRDAPHSRARSTGFSITLQYQGATVSGWR